MKNSSPSSSSTGNWLIICNPFAEESIIAHRTTVNLARRFAKEGFSCMRFDYMGEGDSDGEFSDATVSSRLTDIRAAVTYVRKELKAKQVGLVGIRFGATLAATACAGIDKIDPLILIAPILDGSAYVGQLLRSNLTFQMAAYRAITKDRKALVEDLLAGKTVNVDGYQLSKRLYLGIEKMSLQTVTFDNSPRTLLVDINRSETQPVKKPVFRFVDKLKSAGIPIDLKLVTDHFFWADSRVYHPHAASLEEAVTAWLIEPVAMN